MSSSKDNDKDIFEEYGLSTQDQRRTLLGWGRFLVYLGWSLSGITAVVILTVTISLRFNFNWGLFGLLLGALFMAQAIRIVGRMMKKKSNQKIPFPEKKLLQIKLNREKEVRDYFDNNKYFAEKVIQMNSLAKQGKYKDAYNISVSLLNYQIPIPIRDFLEKRKNQYGKLGKRN
jgi:hypothetical protein